MSCFTAGCDTAVCWTGNGRCLFFGTTRQIVAEAPLTGLPAADIFETTPVHIQRHRDHVKVKINEDMFIKGFAPGTGCNCLISTLLSCLNDKGILCVANIEWIREELQRQFPEGDNQVTLHNYLDLRNHWRKIIDLIGISAKRHGCDPNGHIKSENFAVTCVMEDARRVYEADGNGACRLFLINEGNSHFSPLLIDREHWRTN